MNRDPDDTEFGLPPSGPDNMAVAGVLAVGVLFILALLHFSQ
jgi:hypothetical protein